MRETTRPIALSAPHLEREVGLGSATALNMIDMIGVGPFITIPLIVSAAGGPQAMLGWIFGAILALCDGLIWAELGAAMPGSGGSSTGNGSGDSSNTRKERRRSATTAGTTG